MKAISAELPDQLYEEVRLLVSRGWFRDEKDLILDALRRYVDTHKSELMEDFVRKDVEWGLHGKE